MGYWPYSQLRLVQIREMVVMTFTLFIWISLIVEVKWASRACASISGEASPVVEGPGGPFVPFVLQGELVASNLTGFSNLIRLFNRQPPLVVPY